MRKRRRIHINIASIIFICIFIYIIITLISFAARKHIDTYQVIEGPLSGNDIYTALVLRDEKLEFSGADGYINFYVPNNTRAARNQVVCSIKNEAGAAEAAVLTDDDLKNIKRNARTEAINYSSVSFSDIYDFESGLNFTGKKYDQNDPSNNAVIKSSTDGLVIYSIDGYEDIDEEVLTAGMTFDTEETSRKLNDQDHVSLGTPVFKTVTSETWTIYFPLTDLQTVRLASRSNIQVKFLKDGKSERGRLSFLMLGDKRYGRVTFNSGMSRYATDRFLDVELITNTDTGLKIPVSSLVSKEFFLIPESYISYSGEDGSAGIYREVTYKDGGKGKEFINVSLYAETEPEEGEEKMYYVDTSGLSEGDIIVKENSEKRYTIKDTGFLDGVYCINKGYCVFRKVSIIDQNSEYCIVEKNTSFGISLYDYIVLDSSVINEEDLVY